MPVIKIILDAWLDELKEDVLMNVNEGRKEAFIDFSSWTRFTLRDYIPRAYRNLQRYLRSGDFLGIKQSVKLEPLKDNTLAMPGRKYVLALKVGKRQIQLLKELVPFENAARKVGLLAAPEGMRDSVMFNSVPDFVRFKVVTEMLEIHQKIVTSELEDEEEVILKEIADAVKTKKKVKT